MTTLRDTDTDTAAGTTDKATARAHLWILVIIAGAQLMVVLDTTIMIIALPSAQHALGFSNTDRQWVVTAYTLAFGGFLLLGGRISDMIGPKRTLMIGVTGFALASAIGGASQTTLMLIGARGLQGLFGALLAPSVLSILSWLSRPEWMGQLRNTDVSFSSEIGYEQGFLCSPNGIRTRVATLRECSGTSAGFVRTISFLVRAMDGSGQSALVHPFCPKGWTNG